MSEIAKHLECALKSLRKCREHIKDEDGRALLYHAGMTIRDLQARYDESEQIKTRRKA